jgi:hypothetical protein
MSFVKSVFLSLSLSLCLCVCISAAPTWQIYLKFDIGNFHENRPKKSQIWLQRAPSMKTYVNNQQEIFEISGLGGGVLLDICDLGSHWLQDILELWREPFMLYQD